jgi:hypothetical protein
MKWKKFKELHPSKRGRALTCMRYCEKHNQTIFTLVSGSWRCRACHNESARIYNKKKKRTSTQYAHDIGLCVPMSENKKCSAYLGVYIAERILSKYFEDVIVMPFGNPGYDFVCKNGFKIDVKSSTLHEMTGRTSRWGFCIRCNEIADYFLCLAFNDDREDLIPLHIWLIPGPVVCHYHNGFYITNNEQGIKKWSQYEKPLDKVVNCCNVLRRI